jgi:hypothetical protein
MNCLQTATTSLPSLFTVVVLLFSAGLTAFVAVQLGMRLWEVYHLHACRGREQHEGL